MRTTTADQDYVLALKDRSVHVRVFVDRGSGDWVDLTTLENRDWLRGVEYSGTIDKAPVSALIRVQHRIEDLSMSPLLSTSKLNASGVLLEVGHPIYIETATMPMDTPPVSTDWVEVFRGEIDEVQWNTNPIQIRCRDESGALDRFIETQVKRPFTLDVDRVENIMQEILDGELGEGVVTLYSITGTAATPFKPAESPNWLVPSYVQRKQTLIQALRVLADQVGWHVRYLWNTSTSAFELTFYEPGRELAAQGSIFMSGQPGAGDDFDLNVTTFTEGVDWDVEATVAETAASIAAALNTGAESGNISKAWTTGATYASGTITFTGQPNAGEDFDLNATSIAAVAGAPANNQFQIGGTLTATLDNLVTALRTGCDEQDNITAARIGSTVKIAWGTAGSAGSAITFQNGAPNPLSNATFDGAGTLGGTDEGYDAIVTVEWGTKGTAGNAIVWVNGAVNPLANCTFDGGGTLGGTILGQGTSIDHTIGPDRYHSVTALKISRTGVRNAIDIKYGTSQINRTTISVTDATSIAKYGRKWMEVAEGATSQIDTESEATRMANAILEDLKDPDADQAVEMPYFWPVEVGDFDRFEANDYHYDTDQDLAVLAFRHQLAENRSRTTLSCRGKPSGGFKRWLALEARPGVNPQNDFYQHNAAEGSTTSQGVGLIVVTYDDPRSMKPPINDWAFTRCHVSTSGGFTPDDSNLVAIGRQTRFDVGGLVPGTTYYIKLIIVTVSGAVAATSTQVSCAAEKVAAYHEDTDRLNSNLVPNGTFGHLTFADEMPDRWTAETGSLGTEITLNTTEHETGGRSLELTDSGGGDGEVWSDFIPVTVREPYVTELGIKASAVTGAAADYDWGYRTYDKDKAFIAETRNSYLSFNYWYKLIGRGIIFAPALASTVRYVKFLVQRNDVAGGLNYHLYVDRMLLRKEYHKFAATQIAGQAIAAGGAVVPFPQLNYDHGGQITMDGVRYGINLAADPNPGRYNCNQEGVHFFNSQVEIVHVGAATTLIELYKNGAQAVVGQTVTLAGAGSARVFVAGAIDLARNDYVEVYVTHNGGAPRNTSGGNINYFHGTLMPGAQ